ncbi:hypothetical protein FQZ97_907950 [compost metagenome]
MTRSMAVSYQGVPRISDTSVRVFPIYFLRESCLKPMSSDLSGPAARQRFSQLSWWVCISLPTFFRMAGSCNFFRHSASPPSCTQVGMAASRPVAPAV